MARTRIPLAHLRRVLAACSAIAIFLPGPVTASPFVTRDQNPLLAGFGLPLPMPSQIAPDDFWRMSADFNWGSSAIVQTNDVEDLIVDAETRELRLTFERAITDRWSARLQLPYRYTGAGTLDSFIDSWHDFFGLPEGMRPLLPQDAFRIAYARDMQVQFDYPASEGLGDISTDLGYQLLSTPASSVATWLSVKLPTGDADDLTGSGAIDASLVLAGAHRFEDRWSVFGQVAITGLGDGDMLPEQQRSLVWSGLAGIGVNVWRGLELTLQFDGHTSAFDDTTLDYLGDAMILTIGGSWTFTSGWQLDIGVSEDIMVDASPDVVFVIGVRQGKAEKRLAASD